ncbi:MAG: cytidylate kinase family protein [Candidatus Rokubacteria bacterium]|nr:cytidylate kinase family protein [Candidatus Rokubacteria bacterium]
MAIICLSHEMGAGGPEIGQLVGQRLGYRYIDQELISDAALRYGLLEEKLSHLDESKPSFFERFDAETRRYITVIQTALYEFAEGDNVVLMGRGGQWLLRGIPHVLRIRVMARRDDTERAGRMRYLYEVDLRDPALYDVVVNTEKLSVEGAVDLVAGLARRPELATTPPAAQLVADRSLGSRVQVALATHPETRKYRITVEARAGIVTLEGTAALEEAVDVARTVDGVREVKTQQVEIPAIPPFVA